MTDRFFGCRPRVFTLFIRKIVKTRQTCKRTRQHFPVATTFFRRELCFRILNEQIPVESVEAVDHDVHAFDPAYRPAVHRRGDGDDHAGAGSPCRFDTRTGVLGHDAPGRGQPDPFGGPEVDIRRRLA